MSTADLAPAAEPAASAQATPEPADTLKRPLDTAPSTPTDDAEAPPAKRARLESTSPPEMACPAADLAQSSARYRTGLFLAPMVRIGTLTTRLIALENGASLVWGPEIIDKAMIERPEDGGVVRYVRTGDASVWETHPIEKSRLIYQMGSADPELAVEAAKIVQNDVSGIDLNPFSTHSGMGAALLQTPDLLCSVREPELVPLTGQILRALVANIDRPISCKIRMLPDQDRTIALVRQVCSTGISCLTIHCRTPSMRDREAALLHRLRALVDVAAEYGVPVVANGDCFGYADGDRIREQTGVTSLMIARGAEANPTCFRPDGPRDAIGYVIPTYLRLARLTAHSYSNVKYCLSAGSLAPLSKKQRGPHKAAISQAKTFEQLCASFGVDPAARESVEELCPTLAAAVNWQGASAPVEQLVAGEPVPSAQAVVET